MATKQEAQQRLFNLLERPEEGRATPTDEVEMPRFALMILLSAHATFFDNTLRRDGTVNMDTVRQWFSDQEISQSVVEEMVEYRSTFAATQRAWYKLSNGYQDPPCPDDGRFRRLVDFIRTL